jgi:hypothetical protein
MDFEHDDFHHGNPGRSARREAARRRERRDRRVRERYRWLAPLWRAVAQPSAHERSWATGAEGEELVARSLARRCPSVLVLHDRRMPGSRANIDHLAVASTGVWVIDAKRYSGKVKVSTPLFGDPRLTVGGRERPKLVSGLEKQVAAVRRAMADFAPQVPVHGCLCFVEPQGLLTDSGLPLLRTPSINGYPLFHRRRLASRLNRPGSLNAGHTRTIAGELARRFPSA